MYDFIAAVVCVSHSAPSGRILLIFYRILFVYDLFTEICTTFRLLQKIICLRHKVKCFAISVPILYRKQCIYFASVLRFGQTQTERFQRLAAYCDVDQQRNVYAYVDCGCASLQQHIDAASHNHHTHEHMNGNVQYMHERIRYIDKHGQRHQRRPGSACVINCVTRNCLLYCCYPCVKNCISLTECDMRK